jgi:anti-sigma factor RsiW
MNCERCEQMLAAYVTGDLAPHEEEAVEHHIARCGDCSAALNEYRALVSLIGDAPTLRPTLAESRALTMALAAAPICRPTREWVSPRRVYAFLGFAFASLVVFAVIVSVLALQLTGRIDILAITSPLGSARLVAILVTVIFITSFVPILVTAKRRPLNGMTFRR